MNWVQTNENLPQEDELVILWSKSHGISFGWYCNKNKSNPRWVEVSSCCHGDNWSINTFTHWIYTPKEPE